VFDFKKFVWIVIAESAKKNINMLQSKLNINKKN